VSDDLVYFNLIQTHIVDEFNKHYSRKTANDYSILRVGDVWVSRNENDIEPMLIIRLDKMTPFRNIAGKIEHSISFTLLREGRVSNYIGDAKNWFWINKKVL
jgi:hypothetical protein